MNREFIVFFFFLTLRCWQWLLWQMSHWKCNMTVISAVLTSSSCSPFPLLLLLASLHLPSQKYSLAFQAWMASSPSGLSWGPVTMSSFSCGWVTPMSSTLSEWTNTSLNWPDHGKSCLQRDAESWISDTARGVLHPAQPAGHGALHSGSGLPACSVRSCLQLRRQQHCPDLLKFRRQDLALILLSN